MTIRHPCRIQAIHKRRILVLIIVKTLKMLALIDIQAGINCWKTIWGKLLFAKHFLEFNLMLIDILIAVRRSDTMLLL